MDGEQLLDEDDFLDAANDRGPVWRVRVMLAVMRGRGTNFNTAWHSALARLRAQPGMDPDSIEELMAAKAWLAWARAEWEAAYNREPKAQLVDGETFTPAELANLARTERTGGNGRRTRAASRTD